ncbi:MAG: FtsX-like permease family protein [Verrucomicrobiae bacterium]|nr:FtsX-like permease family protein [Verrucomicrobiae bacterium]
MSRLPFELLLALRYLRPKRTFVSVITLISVVGVTLGVAVLIIVISVMNGFDRDLRDRVFGFNAHLRIWQRDGVMGNYALVGSVVATNPAVRGVAPFVLGQVLVETQPEHGPAQVFAPVLRGVDARAEATVSELPRSIVAGSFDLSGRGLVVGTVLAENLNVWLGDRLAVYSPEDLKKLRAQKGGTVEQAVLPEDYEIRGIFDAGYYEFNATVIVASLENAQTLYALEESDSVHGLTVALRDPYAAQRVAGELQQALGPAFKVSTWMEDSPLMLAVLVEKNVMLYILFFIVLVAAFGITCTLITFIVMKTREIGLLKALGASNRQVMWVFLGQSLVVSVAGVLVGMGLGFLALAYRNEFLALMRRATGFELFPAKIYGFSQLPALIVPTDVAIICGGSLLICLLAAAFPARYASRLNPVEALRYE